jgi:signal transduction histidine kinase
MPPKRYASSVTSDPAFSAAADSRMADLALFAKGVVHDLRNPLNVVVTNLYLLRQRLEGAEPRVARPLERLGDQVAAVEHLLAGYLAFDLAEHPAFQRVNLNEFVDTVAASFVLSEGFALQVELAPDCPIVSADPRLIDAALRAAVRNAIRALNGEGAVTLMVCSEPGAANLIVQDDGPGIPSEILPRVFEPFFSTWTEHAGVGLPLVDRVARAHSGKATISSTPGEGTQVALSFPVEATASTSSPA